MTIWKKRILAGLLSTSMILGAQSMAFAFDLSELSQMLEATNEILEAVESLTDTEEPIEEDDAAFTGLLGLADPCDPTIIAFAQENAGKELSFQCYVSSVAAGGGASDYYLHAGTAEAWNGYGPNFCCASMSQEAFHLKNPSDLVQEGSTLNMTARILSFDQGRGAILLEPVETKVRTLVSQLEDSVIRPEFKDAMDSYEAFWAEYCNFMQNYDASDTSMLMQYLSLLDKEVKMTQEFEDWEEEDMTAAELAYYTEVSVRVLGMMAGAMSY